MLLPKSFGRKSVIHTNRQRPGPASSICIDALWWVIGVPLTDDNRDAAESLAMLLQIDGQ